MRAAVLWYAVPLAGLVLLGGTNRPVGASEVPSPLELSLEASVSMSLAHNLGIAAESLGCQVAEEKVLEALAASHPALGAGLSVGRGRNPTASVLEGGQDRTEVTEEQLIWDTSLSQPLPAGGSLALHFGNDRFETDSEYQTINPVYRSALSLEWTQPLLRGFGRRAHTASATLAQHNRDAAESLFDAYVADVIAQTCGRYWELVYAQADLEAKQTAHLQARQIQEMTEADMDEGRRAITDVLKARAEVASRLGEVAAAQEAVRDAEDQLRLIMNLPGGPGGWGQRLVPTTALDRSAWGPDEGDALREAQANRPELKAAASQYAAVRLESALARNSLLPSLDMVGRMSLSGMGEEYKDDVSQLRSRDFGAWSVGLTTRIPLGNRAARSAFRQRDLQERQMRARTEELKQRVVAEVRQAARRIQTCVERLDASEQVRRFREMNLDATQERFRLGMATSENALEAQKELADAKSGYVRALVDYNNARIHLEAVKGTLSDQYPFPAR